MEKNEQNQKDEETVKKVEEVKNEELDKQELEETKTDIKKESNEVKKEEENKKVELKEEAKKIETIKKDDKTTSKTPNKTDINKSKNNQKIVIAIVAIVIIIAIACGGYFIMLNSTKTSAINDINNIFTALKSGNQEEIKKYLGEETVEEVSGNAEDDNSKEMAKVMLNNLEYEIVSTNVNFKEGTVILKVSNKDLETVFENYMKKVFSLAFSQALGKMSEEDFNAELLENFKEQYNSENVETITNEITIKMSRENGIWKIDADQQQIVNAILPGYESVMNSLNNIEE